MSVDSILSGITGISDGGKNTAAEFRAILTDMTETLLGTTSSGVTNHIADETIHYEQSGITITKSQISDLGNPITGYTETDTLDSVTSRGSVTANDIQVQGLSAHTIQINNLSGETGVGRITWNEDYGTMNLGMKGGLVTLQVGQEMYINARAGETLSELNVVYNNGVQGDTGRLIVEKFIANNSIDELYVLGVTTEPIANNANGFITTFGVIHNVDTTGIPYGETWAEADILYASPFSAGTLTNIQPISPNLIISVGMVLNRNAITGNIFIRPTLGAHLTELHDVLLSGVTVGDYLSFNGSVWVNTKIVTTIPSTSTSSGIMGQIAYDATYLYTCVATNLWVRTPLTSW